MKKKYFDRFVVWEGLSKPDKPVDLRQSRVSNFCNAAACPDTHFWRELLSLR